MKVRFPYATADYDDAHAILFGVPDESGSRARRKGAAEGPWQIRKAAMDLDLFLQKGQRSLVQPLRGSLPQLHDVGNVRKKDISAFTEKISKAGKLPVMIGGDHSSTFHAVKGLGKKVSLVYIDAHPDSIGNRGYYYGSVVWDILKNKLAKSVTYIGLRSCEAEELAQMRESKAAIFDMVALQEKGLRPVLRHLRSLRGKVYLSVDLDSIDPAYAPGVGAPHPGGLTSREILQLTATAAKKHLIGFDIMELCPRYDIHDRTAHLAAQITINTLANLHHSQ